MSKKLKVVLNSAGVRALLRSAEMREMLQSEADTIARKCGNGYQVDSYTMPTREVSKVSAVSPEAKRDNQQNNTIVRALR